MRNTAHRIDREPVLFLGCSSTEIFLLALAGAIGGIFIGIVIGALTGWWFIILPCIFIGAFVGVYRGGILMEKKKEGKPEGYYGKVILSALSKSILNLFVNRKGYWSIRK